MAYTMTTKQGNSFLIGDYKITVGEVRGAQDFDLIVDGGDPHRIRAENWVTLAQDVRVQATYGKNGMSHVVRVRIDAPYSPIQRIKVCEVCKGEGSIILDGRVVTCPECGGAV
jgi:hypothetical protein